MGSKALAADRVVCRSDSAYPERPTALYYDGRRLDIAAIIARWRTPDERHFRVQVVGGDCFTLVYNQDQDCWRIDPE
jgi:hypothetical protein